MSDDLTDDQIAAAVAALDGQWHGEGVGCMCPGKPHGEQGCGSPATVVIERHLINDCTGGEANSQGNRVEVMCLKCSQDLWVSAYKAIAHLRAHAHGGVPVCSTCGAPMVRPSDLVRSAQRFDGGVR